jgi:hypothetical protein
MRMHGVMDDGDELDIGPGGAMRIPPGYDTWIVGDEPYVGVVFKGGGEYAKRST